MSLSSILFVCYSPYWSSWTSRLRVIYRTTRQHALNLAKFVSLYKTLLLLQRKINGKQQDIDTFIAGLIGGYIVFGERNAVNEQVYLITCFSEKKNWLAEKNVILFFRLCSTLYLVSWLPSFLVHPRPTTPLRSQLWHPLL